MEHNTSNTYESEFVNICQANGLIQYNTHPSRQNGDNILDLAFSNCGSIDANIESIDNLIDTDHHVLNFVIRKEKEFKKQGKRQILP